MLSSFFPGTVGYIALAHLQKASAYQRQSTHLRRTLIGSSALLVTIHVRGEHPLSIAGMTLSLDKIYPKYNNDDFSQFILGFVTQKPNYADSVSTTDRRLRCHRCLRNFAQKGVGGYQRDPCKQYPSQHLTSCSLCSLYAEPPLFFYISNLSNLSIHSLLP